MTPSVPSPLGSGDAASQAGRTVPARAWIQNVETGAVRSVFESELAAVKSPWRQISTTQAVREHLKSIREELT